MLEDTNVEKPSLVGMITNPTEQFERIRKQPLIWGAMGIIIILFIIGLWLSSLGIDFSEVITTENELIIEEEFEEFVKAFEKIGFFIGGIIGPILGVLVSSVIYLLVAKIVQSAVTFRQLFSMNTYIMIITVLGVIINGIFFAIFGGQFEDQFTSLGSLINLQGPVGIVFDNLEVFSIWNLILTAIGLEKVARFSKGLAWAVPITIFVIGILFAVMGANIEI